MKTLKVSESIGPNLWCWESSCSFDFHLDGGIRNIWLEWPIPWTHGSDCVSWITYMNVRLDNREKRSTHMLKQNFLKQTYLYYMDAFWYFSVLFFPISIFFFKVGHDPLKRFHNPLIGCELKFKKYVSIQRFSWECLFEG